jgi:hypothetical protein
LTNENVQSHTHPIGFKPDQIQIRLSDESGQDFIGPVPNVLQLGFIFGNAVFLEILRARVIAHFLKLIQKSDYH